MFFKKKSEGSIVDQLKGMAEEFSEIASTIPEDERAHKVIKREAEMLSQEADALTEYEKNKDRLRKYIDEVEDVASITGHSDDAEEMLKGHKTALKNSKTIDPAANEAISFQMQEARKRVERARNAYQKQPR